MGLRPPLSGKKGGKARADLSDWTGECFRPSWPYLPFVPALPRLSGLMETQLARPPPLPESWPSHLHHRRGPHLVLKHFNMQPRNAQSQCPMGQIFTSWKRETVNKFCPLPLHQERVPRLITWLLRVTFGGGQLHHAHSCWLSLLLTAARPHCVSLGLFCRLKRGRTSLLL